MDLYQDFVDELHGALMTRPARPRTRSASAHRGNGGKRANLDYTPRAMSDGTRKDTALGVARARFVEGLARKATELKGAVALLFAAPGSDRPREEMRRRLHALYASAQVFRIEPLADALRECIQRIDASRDQKRALSQQDLDTLATLATTLPTLAVAVDGGQRPSVPPPTVVHEVEPPPIPRQVPAEDAYESEMTVRLERAPLPQAAPRGVPVEARKPVLETLSQASVSTTVARVQLEKRAVPVSRGPGPLSAARAALPAGASGLGTVVSVLVLDGAESQAQVRGALPVDHYEVLASASPEEALRLARSSSPDVVLADQATLTRSGSDFIARLRNDPLTDFVPVIMLVPPGSPVDPIAARTLGADDAVGKPVDPQVLLRVIGSLLGVAGQGGGIEALGAATLEQIADRLALEIRSGLVGSVESGGDVSVPLGDGAEVLAAAWSAIARVRAHVAARSSGRVRFRDLPRRGGPAVMALVDEEDAAADEAATEVSLDGRRILVVDDDPAVLWFFAGLFRESGAEVFEATDGREALARLRTRRVDVVVSDILMPHIDGFALCREIQRDPALEGIPVILLSWKEDLIQRMRDLQSGASGYLRKEAGSAQILSRVRDVLRARARLEAQLRTGGEVRGSLERIGIQNVLGTVAQVTRSARLTVRDAWNLFEIDLRDGNLVHLTRTATDGSFARGDAALLQLLGATAGRFTVVASDAPVRPMFKEPFAALLERGTHNLGALVDAVSGTWLPLADRMEFDDEVLASLLGTSPEPSRVLVERLRRGETPRGLIVAGEVAPQVLESVLIDLARRGALLGVRGAAGEDRVAEAFAARTDAPGGLHTSSPKASTPPPPLEDEAYEEGDPALLEESNSGIGHLEPLPAPTKSAAASPGKPASPGSQPGLEWLGVEENTAEIVAETRRMTREKVDADRLPPTAAKLLDEGPSAVLQASSLPSDAPAATPSPASEKPAAAPASVSEKPSSVSGKPAPASVKPVGGRQPPPSLTPAAAVPQATPEPRGWGASVWFLIIGSLAVLGYFGGRAWDDGTLPKLLGMTPPLVQDTGVDTLSAEGDAGAVEAVPDAGPLAAAPQPPADGGAAPSTPGARADLTADELRFGRVEAGIAAGGVAVSAEQGLLVVELGPGGPARVFVDSRDVGAAPVRLALIAGPHEIAFHRGEDSSFRFLNIRAGHTHTVATP
jgi:DNA-binding response OmpR family regulator